MVRLCGGLGVQRFSGLLRFFEPASGAGCICRFCIAAGFLGSGPARWHICRDSVRCESCRKVFTGFRTELTKWEEGW